MVRQAAADLVAAICFLAPVEVVKWLLFRLTGADVAYVFISVPIFVLVYYRGACAGLFGLILLLLLQFVLYQQARHIGALSANNLSLIVLAAGQMVIVVYFAAKWRRWLLAERSTSKSLRISNEYRDFILSTLSHDLRNPLTAISGTIGILRRYCNVEPVFISRLEKSCQRMTRMLDELTELARMQLGQGIQLHITQVELVALVHQMADETKLIFPDAIIDVQTNSTTIVGLWDETRIGRLLSNLLVNACKYGDRRRPVVIRTENLPASVRITVRNDGEPIDPMLLPLIFDPFKRGKKNGKGLGLGLYIAKEIVEKHGGMIEVFSTAETGTTFTVSLSREPPN